MAATDKNLCRSVRSELFASGAIIGDKPAAEILFPDFAPREIRPGKMRAADVTITEDEDIQWLHGGGGTSLCDGENVFKSNPWCSFAIPAGTEVPDSLKFKFTGRNKTFHAEHYQIESAADRMRLDA